MEDHDCNEHFQEYLDRLAQSYQSIAATLVVEQDNSIDRAMEAAIQYSENPFSLQCILHELILMRNAIN